MSKRQLKADDCSPLAQAEERGELKLVSYGRGQYPGRRLKTGQLPGLRTIGYWNAVGHQTWGLPMHRNEGIEICYVLSGEIRFSTDSEEWQLKPGDITITRPWQRHCLGDPRIRACKLFWLILDIENKEGRGAWEFPAWIGPDLDSRRQLLRIFRKNQRCHLRDESRELNRFMQNACEGLSDGKDFLTARLSSLINHLILEVGERLSGDMGERASDSQGFDPTVREFFHGLEASVDKAAEPWGVSEIAHTCRVGVTYLTASCREIFNTTPAEQVNRMRLHHAARMLREDLDQSVTDVAMATGFSTSQYFATCFRKQFGVSPRVYRQSGMAGRQG